jgi:hypothetical protein
MRPRKRAYVSNRQTKGRFLIRNRPLALVAGAGFEPATSGLRAVRRTSLASQTISRGCGDLGGPERARRARSAPSPLSHPIPGRPVYKSVYMQRTRSRLWRPETTSFEFAHLSCLGSINYLPSGRDHSAHIPDHGYFRCDRPTSQGMVRVRSGQAAAWPLVSGRSARSGLQGQA